MTGRTFWTEVVYALEERTAQDRVEKRRMAYAVADGAACLLSGQVPDPDVLYRAWAGLADAARTPEPPDPAAGLRAAWEKAAILKDG